MTKPQIVDVALSFADGDIDFAKEIAIGLSDIGYRILSDSLDLNDSLTWGRHKFELIQETYSIEIPFTIVIVTKEFIDDKWSGQRRCAILEKSILQKGRILPICVGDKTYVNRHKKKLGISHIGSIDIKAPNVQQIVNSFTQMVNDYWDNIDVNHDTLYTYKDAERVILLYNKNPSIVVKKIDSIKQAAVGFDLYEAQEELTKRSTFFLSLHGGTTIKSSAEEFFKRHSEINTESSLIILIPREKGQKKLQDRIKNVSKTFNPIGSYYIDEFLWENCTSKEFKEEPGFDDVPNFVDPKIDLPSSNKSAFEFVREWLKENLVSTLIISGLGGIGKTTVVRQTASFISRYLAKKVVFIESREILSYLVRDSDNSNLELDVYSLYKASCARKSYTDNDPKYLSKDLFKCNLDNGNIVIIIDGLDEIISRLGSQFNVQYFIESISELCDSAENGKVIITCRDNFIPSDEELSRKYQLVKLLPFDQKLAEQYFNSRFPSSPKNVERALKLSSSFKRCAIPDYVPFVLHLVGNIVQDRIDALKNDLPVVDYEFDLDFLSSEIENDYITFKICSRELSKYPNSLSTNNQFLFFVDLAVVHSGVISLEKIKIVLEELLDQRISESHIEALADHPLLEKKGEYLEFRYDFFDSYFEEVFVSMVLNNIKKVSRLFIERIGREARYNIDFVKGIYKRVKDSDDFQLKALNLIHEIKDFNGDIKDIHRKQAISSMFLLYVENESKGNTLSRVDYSDMVKDVFQEKGKIVNFCFVGINSKIVFDFSGFIFESAYISEYDFFWECTFDRHTYFDYCELYLLSKNPKLATSASKVNFNLSNCKTDQTILNALEAKQERVGDRKKSLILDFRSFLSLFIDSGRLVPAKENVLKGKYRGNYPYKKIQNLLAKGEIINLHESEKVKKLGKEYEVNAEYTHKVLDFCLQNTTLSALNKIAEAEFR